VIPVIDAERLLEHEIVLASGLDADDERTGVLHVVAADLARAVGHTRTA
jgi:hypothetical protein